MRYIIGLSPLIPSFYIKVAQDLFQDVYDGYILSETIAPHITITQFDSDDIKIPQKLWGMIEELKIQECTPKMIGVSFIKGLNDHKNYFWAQIAVERDPVVMKIHNQILKLLEKNQLESLVDSGDIYKPHITLARIKLLKPLPLWPSEILESSAFKITLGESDQNGRYLKTIYPK